MSRLIKYGLLSTAAVYADYASMQEDFKANILDKTINQNDMGLINEYGCWCYFQDDHPRGRSGPVDQIDILCKRLHDGYSCAMMDAKFHKIGRCTPWEITYNSAVGSGLALNMDLDTIRTECDTQNPDLISCENWTCKVEGYFVQQLLLFFTNGGLINHDNRHDMGFNPLIACPITAGVESDRECCNEYPLRFPYKTYDGARDCCITHTFDTNMYSCCTDGVVRVTC